MKRIILPLFILFFIYRIAFWDGSGAELFNMFFNAVGDTFASFFCGLLLFQKVSFNKETWKNYLIEGGKGVLILLAAIAILYIYHRTIYTLSDSLQGRFEQTFSLISFQIFDLFTVLFIGTTIVIAFLKNKSLKEREAQIIKLEEARKKAEIAFLRSQMDPHFIFNTLNAIHHQVDDQNREAQDLIIKFSDLIRFHLYDFQEDYIPLEKEIDFVKSYIEIMKVRKSENLEVRLEIKGNVETARIPPLIIIPIVENCFKHSGNLLKKNSLIDIKIIVENDFLQLIARNTKKEANISKEIKEPGGIGLKNVKERLNLYFKGDYGLKIQEDEEIFQLQLKVPIEHESLHT